VLDKAEYSALRVHVKLFYRIVSYRNSIGPGPMETL